MYLYDIMQDILAKLLEWDKTLFLYINGQWTNSLLDTVMPWLRNANNWIPLYVIILSYLFYNWGKMAWKWVVLVALNVALTDQISSHIFKPFFQRLRPCADPNMFQKVRLLLDHCSGGFSFTSSHAANHFGVAFFIVITLSPLFKNYRYFFLIWAALIAYAQVYVGVHYPLDILVGSIIGCVVGYFNGLLFHKWQSK